MNREALRTLILLGLIAWGFLLWPYSRESMAIGCWVMAAVYALATGARRWL